ncbi:patatin-like phospholipase family protein [Leisingera sp. ANG59]|uniref:patatin-like phospholipase family protein n=1 Tax=Leisingera sp. ANG59 TaxID=2675221 RepID=UPI0015738206|nr:patatin-like phospholipase family protein [Leisingera sp. ANG59]NSY38516.1 patatin-like phospholipase family protein [Leisingera sp. ANG59]
MPDTPSQSKKIALVLQGGGARGAYQVGALKAIAELSAQQRSPFQIICGASAGAINAASIAAASNSFQNGVQHTEKLWRSLRCNSIFDTRALPLLLTSLHWAGTLLFGHLGLRATGGFLDYSALRALLEREFNHRHLQRAIRSGALHAFCITASSYSEGKAVTFFDGHKDIAGWTRARRRGERTKIGPDHLLASSALPFAFAPVRIGGGFLGDGSLRLTSPLSPAIHTGASRIVVIATRDQGTAGMRSRPEQDSPSIGEIAGHALDILFNDNLESDYERLSRVNHTLSLLSPEARQQTPLRIIEALLLSPSRDLRETAVAHASEMPQAVRLLIRSMGGRHGDGRLESYLLFEPGYIGALIQLGYADTMDRAGEVLAFLRN